MPIRYGNQRAIFASKRNTTIAIPAGPILDALSATPSAAYGLRKLRAAYIGPCIKVRRSSDSTEQDIGFDGSGNLDLSALNTFVGAGSGFVSVLYDQSAGTSYNATQVTTGNQPRIMNAGVLEALSNGRPTIQHIQANSTFLSLLTTGLSLFQNLPGFTMFGAMKLPAATGTQRIITATINAGVGVRESMQISATNNIGMGIRRLDADSSALLAAPNNSYVTGAETLLTMRHDFASQAASIHRNGNLIASSLSLGTAGAASENSTSQVLRFGQAGDGTLQYLGTMSEFIVFQSSISDANRQLLEASIMNYYGLT